MAIKMKIAVIIPMYNSCDTIVDVLKGLEFQEQACNIEKVIIVDDGSTDNSCNSVEEYAKQSNLAICLIKQPNKGVASARNRGVKEVGEIEWIAFCDSDDVWIPNKLSLQVKTISEHPDIDCLGGAYSSNVLRIGLRKITKLYKACVKDICISNFPQPSTVLMKKSVFDEIGGFDENQRYAEDGNFFLRVAANYNLYYTPEQLIVYGYGKRGFGVKGLSSNLKAMYEGNKKNIREMRDLNYISGGFFYTMRIYFFAKYLRRLIIGMFYKLTC